MTRWVWTTFENKHLMMGDLIYAYCIAADCMLLVGAVRPKQVVQVIVFASRPPHYCRKKRKSNPGSISHPGKEGQTSDQYQKYRHSDYAPPTPPYLEGHRYRQDHPLLRNWRHFPSLQVFPTN